MANKSRDTANLVSAKTGIAVTLTGDPVVLGVGNTEHVRLTGGGRLGVGTDNPSHKLDVIGNTQLFGTLVVGNNSDISPDSGGSGQFQIDANGYAPYIAADATAMYIGHNSSQRDIILQTDETDRLTIDGSTGNIGIGTDNPDTSLHIHSNTAASFDAIRMSGKVKRKNVIKVNNSDNLIVSIDEDNEGDDSNFRLQIDGSEKVRITSTGNIGIGTDNPASNLHVIGTIRVGASGEYTVDDSRVQHNERITCPQFTGRGSDGYVDLKGDSGATSFMRILDSGNIGIGTDNPEEDLHIEADNPTIKLLDTTPGGDDDYVVVSHLNGTTSIDSYYNGAGGVTRFRQASTEYARLDTNGRIGIGTDNPSQQVHIGKYGDHARIRIESSGTGNRSGIEFYRETSAGMNKGGAGIWVESNTSSSAGVLNFGTASNAGLHSQQSKMILDGDGHLGIGTDNNESMLLTLADGSSSGIFMGNVGVNGYRIRSNISNTANYGIMIEDQDGVDLWRITGPDGSSSSTRNTHQLYINGTEHLRLDSSGRLNVESITGTATAARFGTLDGSSYENLENNIIVYGHSASDYTLLRGCNTADGTPVFDAQVSGTRKIEIEANGDVHNATGTFSQISDSQFKENIVDSPSQWEDVKALRVRKFNFTEASGYQTHTQIGYVAQEVEQVSPGLIKTRYLYNEEGEEISGSDYKTVKVSLINVKAVKALQEAMARIEILESRLNSAGIATT